MLKEAWIRFIDGMAALSGLLNNAPSVREGDHLSRIISLAGFSSRHSSTATAGTAGRVPDFKLAGEAATGLSALPGSCRRTNESGLRTGLSGDNRQIAMAFPPDVTTSRHHQLVAVGTLRRPQAAAEDDQLRIKDIDEPAHTSAQGLSGGADDLRGTGVVGRRGEHVLAGLGVSLDQVES